MTNPIGKSHWILAVAFCLVVLTGNPPLVLGAKKVSPAYGPYPATLVRVIDGDTVVLDVALWPGLVQRIHLRLEGVNTPEKRGKSITACEKAAAARASAFTTRVLRKARTISISGIRLGKYAGRVLGHLMADGQDLGRALIAAGLARPYAGGKRAAWC